MADSPIGLCPACSRRNLLRAGLGLTAATLVTGVPMTNVLAAGSPQPAAGGASRSGPIDSILPTPLPVPIPELDAFGHHNQPAGPYNEPSQIFNFRGRVASCTLAGVGVDQSGQ